MTYNPYFRISMAHDMKVLEELEEKYLNDDEEDDEYTIDDLGKDWY